MHAQFKFKTDLYLKQAQEATMRIRNIVTLVLGIVLLAGVVSLQAAEKGELTAVASKTQALETLKNARNFAEHMANNVTKFQSLENIAVAYAQLKSFDTALEVANSIESNTNKINSLVWIARQYNSIGNTAMTAHVLSQSLTTAHKMSDNLHKAEVFRTLATEYKKFGMTAQSDGINKQAKYFEKLVYAKAGQTVK